MAGEELLGALAPVLGAREAAPVTGPRSWWGGPLDVEGLALGAVQAAATALSCWREAIGLPGTVTVRSEAVAAAFDSYGLLRVDGAALTAFAPLSGFFRATDGWVRTHANYPHHAAALRSALGLTNPAGHARDAVAAAIGERSATEIEDAVVASGGVAAAVRTPAQWRASDPGRHANLAPWIGWSLTKGEPLPVTPGALPLAGVRVLDLTRVIAGPTATRVLGALGADVLRIDPPHRPEDHGTHLDTGWSKRSALADLRVPEQGAAVRALIDQADVVVMGYRGGALAPFGLAPEVLLERRPDLIIATLDAWGRTGPWAARRGFDSIVQAACGIAWQYRQPDDSPGALPVQALDHATGYGIVAAVLALLTRRAERGGGGHAHLSLARTAAELQPWAEPPSTTVIDPSSDLREVSTVHGLLRTARPPLDLDGAALEHCTPPQRYGTASLAFP